MVRESNALFEYISTFEGMTDSDDDSDSDIGVNTPRRDRPPTLYDMTIRYNMEFIKYEEKLARQSEKDARRNFDVEILHSLENRMIKTRSISLSLDNGVIPKSW